MATVTGLTAARMQEIEDSSVVSGTVVGDNLQLTTRGGTTIPAGNVRGPQGVQGPQGPAGSVLPVGTFIIGGWETDPAGHFILDGSRIVGGAITYPDLAGCFPSWVDGNDIVLPNAEGRTFMVADANPGVLSGSNTHLIGLSNLPEHQHSLQAHTHTPGSMSVDIDHDHANGTTGGGGSHFHETPNLNLDAGGASGSTKTVLSTSGFSFYGYALKTTTAPNHTHTFDVPALNTSNRSVVGNSGAPNVTNTGSVGSGSPVDHTPAHIKIRVAVKY